jgi:serine/threonine protein kinase
VDADTNRLHQCQRPVALARVADDLQDCTKLPTTILPRVSAENLELHEKLGSGVSGDVYRCSWLGKQKAVKIKSKRKNRWTQQPTPLDSEVTILKILGQGAKPCDGIAHLQSWRRCSHGRLYLFFELYTETLHTLIRRCCPWRCTRVAMLQLTNVTSVLGRAVAYVHSLHILHRDIKPVNVLVSGRPPLDQDGIASEWKPVLCDFGNALKLESKPGDVGLWRHNLPTQRYCTLTYAAPEVLMAHTAYERSSDMWSLGLVLAEFELGFAIFTHECSDWEQLLKIWKVFRPNRGTNYGRNESIFDRRLRSDLIRHMPSSTLEREAASTPMKPRLSRVTQGLLVLDPGLRFLDLPFQETLCFDRWQP